MFLKVFGITVGFNSVSHCSKCAVGFVFGSLMLLLYFFLLKIVHFSKEEKSCKAYYFICILVKDTNFVISYPEWPWAAPVRSCSIHAEFQIECAYMGSSHLQQTCMCLGDLSKAESSMCGTWWRMCKTKYLLWVFLLESSAYFVSRDD